MTKPRIAIPVPHSQRPEYTQRSLPQYVSAIEKAGGEAVVIQLDQASEAIAKQITQCQAVLLPGSAADVDPQKYNARRLPQTADADPLRDAVDELLLQDAHNLRKPIFGICLGHQLTGIALGGKTFKLKFGHHGGNHPVKQLNTGKIEITAHNHNFAVDLKPFDIAVNSSHHQSAEAMGDGLRVVARCPEDGVIEAIEGTQAGHFVVAVQWHPERTYDDDAPSRALFRAFVRAAQQYDETAELL